MTARPDMTQATEADAAAPCAFTDADGRSVDTGEDVDLAQEEFTE